MSRSCLISGCLSPGSVSQGQGPSIYQYYFFVKPDFTIVKSVYKFKRDQERHLQGCCHQRTGPASVKHPQVILSGRILNVASSRVQVWQQRCILLVSQLSRKGALLPVCRILQACSMSSLYF